MASERTFEFTDVDGDFLDAETSPTMRYLMLTVTDHDDDASACVLMYPDKAEEFANWILKEVERARTAQ